MSQIQMPSLAASIARFMRCSDSRNPNSERRRRARCVSSAAIVNIWAPMTPAVARRSPRCSCHNDGGRKRTTAGGQARCVDVPPTKRPPIEHGRASGTDFNGQIGRGCPVQDAQGQLSRAAAEAVEIHERAGRQQNEREANHPRHRIGERMPIAARHAARAGSDVHPSSFHHAGCLWQRS